MRAALWFLALFGIAAAVALFAGNNQGTVTVFWPPYRLDLSLNMVLLLLFAGFTLLHLALRGVAALLELPRQASRWRNQQKERAMHVALLDALAHQLAGRFIRARKAAELAIAQEEDLVGAGQPLPHAVQVRALAHLLAAESAQALQDRPGRDGHLQQVLAQTADNPSAPAQEVREGAQMRAARWALDDNDHAGALDWLAQLPQGAARRTLALRIRLKASQQGLHTREALDTARLLAKHRAFSPAAAQSLMRGLAAELIQGSHDTAQLVGVWDALDAAERGDPELAVRAARRLAMLEGDDALGRAWLLPVWERMLAQRDGLATAQQLQLVRAIENGLESIDADWFARIESAQRQHPRDPVLQYLAGMACLRRSLWGKAQQLLARAAPSLPDPGMRRNAWQALAGLAEERGDAPAAAEAWKQAAQVA
jgi:HemY protein